MRFRQEHKKECPSLPVTCSLCGKENIKRSMLSQHHDPNIGECEKSRAVCPFLALGCREKKVRFRLRKNFIECFHSVSLGNRMYASSLRILWERMIFRMFSKCMNRKRFENFQTLTSGYI